MKEYILVVVSVTIFIAIFEGVLPKGKYSKSLKSITSLIVVTVILVPIVNVLNNVNVSYENLNYLDNYEEYIEQYKVKILKEQVKSVVENENYLVEEVLVVSSNENYTLSIIVSDNGIIEEGGHIDSIEFIKELVKEKPYINSWEVLVEFSKTEKS